MIIIDKSRLRWIFAMNRQCAKQRVHPHYMGRLTSINCRRNGGWHSSATLQSTPASPVLYLTWLDQVRFEFCFEQIDTSVQYLKWLHKRCGLPSPLRYSFPQCSTRTWITRLLSQFRAIFREFSARLRTFRRFPGWRVRMRISQAC